MTSPGWDFDYAPLHAYPQVTTEETDFVVATTSDIDAASMVAALGAKVGKVAVTPLLNVHPVFWSRIELSDALPAVQIENCLVSAGVPVRFVTSARTGSQVLGKPADFAGARPRRARDWQTAVTRSSTDPGTPGRWFLGESGVKLDRKLCGSGTGTRLAVIDNDCGDVDNVLTDALVPVGVEALPRSSSHGAMMIGWAVGALPRREGSSLGFAGVAPSASARLYCIPKPGERIFDLPVAIIRAVDDGADVVICATYLDGQTSPLLDDALEFAWRLGRMGRGTPVVFSASREMSSPPGSVHSSLSLGLAEPASDPRVFCIGPSSYDGRWFLWRDRRGALRPFANRGPAMRWLAPGDDMAHPFSDPERVAHAESSGAAAIASGVILLILAQNPELAPEDVHEIVSLTAFPVEPGKQLDLPGIADANDLLPSGVDPDGHNSKHGYGRLNATCACVAARDPIAAALIFMGEHQAALAYERAILDERARRPFGVGLARWGAAVVLRDPAVRHALKTVFRALRLWSRRPRRASTQPPGTIIRQLRAVVRLASASRRVGLPVPKELWMLDRDLQRLSEGDAASFEAQILEWFTRFQGPANTRPDASPSAEKAVEGTERTFRA